MRRPVTRVLTLVAAALLASDAAARDEPSQQSPDDRPVIGLVLAGGGARGAAHVGVLEVLEEMRIPVDFIVGTSMGAIVGGMYASGLSPDEMQDWMTRIDWEDAFHDRPPRKYIGFRVKEVDHLPLMDIEFGYGKKGFSSPGGLLAGQKLNFILRSLLIHQPEQKSFDDLPIPFRCIAADLESGDMVVLDHGDLAKAIRASMAFPGVFTPVDWDDMLLVDGGILRNLPVDVALDMGADVVIAVDVSTPLGEMKKESTFGVLRRSFSVATKQGQREQRDLIREQDILMTPDLDGITTFGSFKPEELEEAIQYGVDAALNYEDQLARLSVSEDEFTSFRERQRAGGQAPDIVIDEVEIVGLSRVSPRLVRRRIRTTPGTTLDMEVLRKDLERVYMIGEFEQVGFELESIGEHDRLIIEATEKSWGPWYMRPGAAIEADLSGNGDFSALVMLNRTQINRLGAQWRSFVALGDFLGFDTEFYQPLEYSGTFFIAPRFRVNRQADEKVWIEDDKFIADTDDEWLALDLGVQFGAVAELRLGARRGRKDIRPPAILGEPVKKELGAWRGLFRLDQLDDARFPRSGNLTRVEVLDSTASLGADDEYTRMFAKTTQAWKVGGGSILGTLEAGHNLGSDLPLYDDFSLGGFLRLSGLPRDRLAGDRLAFGALGYYRPVGEVPSMLGGNLYLGGTLETGNVWDFDQATTLADLRLAGAVFAGVDSILGPLYLGFGVTEGGENSFYLFLGPIF
jgi:NTE family protein